MLSHGAIFVFSTKKKNETFLTSFFILNIFIFARSPPPLYYLPHSKELFKKSAHKLVCTFIGSYISISISIAIATAIECCERAYNAHARQHANIGLTKQKARETNLKYI